MDAATIHAEWLAACVRPWYEPLQALGALEPLGESHTVWIRVAQAQDKSSYVRVLEGITLLALLARADNRLYTRVVKEIWPDHFTSSGAGKSEGLSSVGIKWVAQELPDLIVLGNFASATRLHSPTFSKAVKLMRIISAEDDEDEEEEKEEDHAHVSVCVVADKTCADSEDLTGVLEALLLLVETLPLLHAAGGVKFQRWGHAWAGQYDSDVSSSVV